MGQRKKNFPKNTIYLQFARNSGKHLDLQGGSFIINSVPAKSKCFLDISVSKEFSI